MGVAKQCAAPHGRTILPFRKPGSLSLDAQVVHEELEKRDLSPEDLARAYRCLWALNKAGFDERKLNRALKELGAGQ